MSQTKFTPGPWSISGVGPKGSKRLIFKATDTSTYPVAEVQLDHLDRFGTGETDATAALIAAAPEMYYALEAGFDAICNAIKLGDLNVARDRMAQVLAKARGES